MARDAPLPRWRHIAPPLSARLPIRSLEGRLHVPTQDGRLSCGTRTPATPNMASSSCLYPSVAGKTEVTHTRAFRFLSAAGTVAAQPDWCGGS